MGRFTYEGTVTADIEDRLLFHVELVIAVKLRRGEAFVFSWSNDQSVGGRTAVWINPASSLGYKYGTQSSSIAVNRDWLGALTYTANSPSGLRLIREPAPGRVTAAPTPQGQIDPEI